MNSYTILLMHQFLEERSRSSGLEPVEERIVKNMMINENIFIHKILAFYHFKIFIKYINSWMIFLRKQVEKWGCKYSSSLFMSTNKQISSNKKELANPFRNKQYTNIVKLLQTGISQKNQSMFNRLVLQDVLYRMQKADHQLVSSYAEITARDKLINKVFERMLAQLKTLNVEDVCLLVKLYSYSQSNRFCKLTADNKQKYRNQVHFRIKNLIEEDKVGANKEVFKDILYTLFASKKMLYILKDLINYLGQYDMKDNSQLHRLFKEIAPLFKTTYYNDEIEPLIIRYMDPSVNKIDNAKQWVKPIVFDIIKIYNFGHRIEGNPLFAHYLDGLEHVFQRNQLQIGDQILIFRSFLKWSQFESPYLWKIDDIGRCVRLIYSMMKDLQEKLKVNQNLNTQLLIALLQSKNYFETFFGFSYGFLNKSYKQLLSQSNQFCWQMFKVQIIDNYQRFEPEDMVAVVYFNISLPNNLQQQFVEVLIKMLEQAEYKSQIIITRLRIYEHIAKLIKQNNYDSYRMSFQKILRKAEESCSSLRQFQLVRLINIFRVLAIKSNTLQKILQFNMKKKEYTIIENFTRTCLKSHSYPFIFDALESLKHKYQSNSVDVLKNITPVIWSSLKRVKIEMIQSNRDQIFIYWLHTNLDYFQSLTKSSQNCYSVYSNAVKQFYMNSKGIRNSINYQILIELMYSWHKQNHTNSSQFQTLVVQNLKTLIQSTGINQILGFQYRHSFFIKLMWGFLFLNKFAPPEESPIKRIRQIRQAHSIIKSIQLGIYRDKPSIKNLLLLRYSKTFNKFNKVHQIRLKMFLLSLNTWMWSNYHNLHLSEQKHSISSPEFIKLIESKLGKIGHFEYLLYSHNKNIDHQFKSLLHQSEVPSQIVQGTLSSNSQIKQNVLLDLLHYKRTLIYLFKKHPGLAQNFILKIIDIKFPPLGIKLLEAANLVNDIKMYIKAQVINKFKDWIKTTLENYSPSHSGAFAKLWVFFNHSTKQTQSAIRTYVASQLQQGNFYLASIFYLNNYIHFENQVLEFLRIVKANHSIPYLESSDIQLLVVINSMLGLSLNQNSNKVLKYFVQSFLCYVQPQAISQNYKQNKYEVHQLYMLLCVGANRLSAGDNEHQRIEILLHELDDRIPDIRKDCLSKLRVKTMKNLEHFAPKQIESVEMQPQLQLPIIKSKVVILDNEQPGYLRNVQQYIKKTLQVDHQLVFTKQTEFAKLEIVSNQ